MKLIFYSGGQTNLNRQIHGAMSDLVGRKRSKSLTYIPFCQEGSQSFYRRAQKRYQPYGFKEFICLPVDVRIDPDHLKRALDSDVIYLAGGNTFYFLHHLRKQRLIQKMRQFAERGGVIAGLSAGGLIMTPNISLAGYPWFDADENEVGLTRLDALKLTQFEFFPHYVHRAAYRTALTQYSKKSKNPIFAIADGGGIVVDQEEVRFLGRSHGFIAGKNFAVH